MTKKGLLIALAAVVLVVGAMFLFMGRFYKAERGVVAQAIKIGTFSKAVDYGPYYIAKRFNWLQSNAEQSAFMCEFKEYNDRETLATELAHGQLDVILAAEAPIIITRAQGVNITILDVSSTLRQEIAVRSNIAIDSAEELRGQRLAVLRGTSSHYGVLQTLKSVNLSQRDLTLEFLPPDVAKGRFEQGTIDAWAVWPPWIEEQQMAHRARILPGGGAVIQSVVAMRQQFVEAQPEVAKTILRGIQRAKRWMLNNPEEAQAIIAQEMDLELDIVKLAWEKHDWGARLNDGFDADMSAKIPFLASEGLLQRGYEEHMKGLVDKKWGGNEPLP